MYYRAGLSPIRIISDGGPLQLQSSDAVDFVCGKNATKAPLVVQANANSRIAFNWVGIDGVSAVSSLLSILREIST